MHLPRHTLTSHGPEPVFINAHFSQAATPADAGKGESSRAAYVGVARERQHAPHATAGLDDSDKHARHGKGKERASGEAGRPRFVQAPASSARRTRTGEEAQGEVPPTQPSAPHVSLLTCATRQGFFVAQTDPMQIKARRGA